MGKIIRLFFTQMTTSSAFGVQKRHHITLPALRVIPRGLWLNPVHHRIPTRRKLPFAALAVEILNGFFPAVTAIPYQGMDLFIHNAIIFIFWVWAGVALRRDPLLASTSAFALAPWNWKMGARYPPIIPGCIFCHTKRAIFFTFWLHHPLFG